jgi:hypothetical protein
MENKETTELKEILCGLARVMSQMNKDIIKLRLDVQAVVTVTQEKDQQKYLDARNSAATHHTDLIQARNQEAIDGVIEYIESVHPDPEKLRELFQTSK